MCVDGRLKPSLTRPFPAAPPMSMSVPAMGAVDGYLPREKLVTRYFYTYIFRAHTCILRK